MKRKLLLLLALMAIGLSGAWAYDFSAVAPSGQRLYYNIVNENVEVTSKTSSYPYYTSLPTGALSIPSSVTYNGTTYSVTNIGDRAFYYCSGLTSVTIPNSVTRIGDEAFYYCSGLTSVTIGNSVTSIGTAAFRGCSGLTSVTIGNSVTRIGAEAFYYCSGLTSVTIPNSVTSIGYAAFYNCDGLTSVTIPNSVTTIGEWAFYCSNVDTLYYNARNLTTTSDWYNSSSSNNYYGFRSMGLNHLVIGDSVQTLPAGVFYNQSDLNSVTIPNSVTSIGNSAFSACSNLTSVTIGSSVSTVGNSAFKDCSSLTSIIIPDEVSMIGNGAFQNCSSAIYLEVGSNVFTIGDSAFAGCSRMMNTRMKCYPPTISYSTFSNYPTNRPVFIPCGTTTAYRNAPYWSVFYNLTEENCGHTVTVASANNHMGITTGGGIYPDGDTATLYAIPLTGYQFDHWNDNNTSNPRNVVVTQDLSYTAFFRTLDTITLIDTVISYVPVHDTTIIDNYIHDTTYIDVFVPVHDTTIIDNYIHDTTYVDVYIHDTTFVDVFVHDTTYIDNYIHDTTYVDVYIHDTTFVDVIVHDTVTEQLSWYSLSVVSGNSARGLVAGNGQFPVGTEVEIAAIPIEGSRFVEWQDGNTENPRRVSLLSDMSFIATFDVADVGVTDVEMAKHTISSQHGQIIVENAAGDRIRIFDEVGRCISTTNSMENTRIFNMPASGVYMVQVGSHPAEKVVVIR